MRWAARGQGAWAGLSTGAVPQEIPWYRFDADGSTWVAIVRFVLENDAFAPSAETSTRCPTTKQAG